MGRKIDGKGGQKLRKNSFLSFSSTDQPWSMAFCDNPRGRVKQQGIHKLSGCLVFFVQIRTLPILRQLVT